MKTKRELPCSPESELYVVSTVLMWPEAAMPICNHNNISPEHFESIDCKQMWICMAALWLRHIPINEAALINELEKEGCLAEIGGKGTIYKMQDYSRGVSGLVAHIDVLNDRYFRRTSIAMSEDLHRKLYDLAEPAGQTLTDLRNEIVELTRNQNQTTSQEVVSNVLERQRSALDKGHTGVCWRWSKLQSLTGGLRNGQITLLCSRPGMGKSTLGLNQARYTAEEEGLSVGFISLEMPEEDLREKMAADKLQIETLKIYNGTYAVKDTAVLDRFKDCMIDHCSIPLTFFCGARGIKQIQTLMYDHAADFDLWVLDYGQAIKHTRGEPSNDRERFGLYSGSLRDTMVDIKRPLLLLLQLNREAEINGRGERKMPTTENIKGTGDWEQDAGQINLVTRDMMYEMDEQVNEDQLMISKCTKNRFGQVGIVNWTFRKQFSQYVDYHIQMRSEEEEF